MLLLSYSLEHCSENGHFTPHPKLMLYLHSPYMYVNEPETMWGPFPVEDSGLAAWYELKTIRHHGVLRIGFCVNMLHACHFLTSLRPVNTALFPQAEHNTACFYLHKSRWKFNELK